MTFSIFDRSFKTILRFSCNCLNSFSALSNMAMTFLFTRLPSCFCVSSASCNCFRALHTSLLEKSYSVPSLPNSCRSCSVAHGCSFSSTRNRSLASFAAFANWSILKFNFFASTDSSKCFCSSFDFCFRKEAISSSVSRNSV